MNDAQLQEIHHAARLALLGMACRGVASPEFDDQPDLTAIVLTISRPLAGTCEADVDVEFRASNGFPIGGVSL